MSKGMEILVKNNKLILIGLLLIFGIFIGVKASNKPVDEFSTEYQVLDESVIANNETITKWIEETEKGKGGFFTSDETDTYILISNGTTTESGVGICLEGFEYGSKIEVKYSIVKSNGETEVEEYTPKMLLKIPKTSKTIVFTEIENK